jgi:hypothetical protein
VVLAACVLPKTNGADGSECSKDDECKSNRCNDGYCSGSSCEKAGSTEGCDDGWKCVHHDADPITGFFGNDGSDTCQPTCGHCPGNYHCPKEAPAGTQCSYGRAPLEITITAEKAIIGRPVKIIASAANAAGPLASCSWEVGDGKPGEYNVGPIVTRTFEDAREHWAKATCKDGAGAIGSGEGKVDVACPPSGDACIPKKCCANMDERCVSSPVGSPTCRIPTPVVLEITGPSTVEVNAEATWTVAAVGGDGQVGSVYWSFSDESFPSSFSSGPTTEHSFYKLGEQKVIAKVTTDINTSGQKELTVNVCQRSGGRCDSPAGVTCCSGLTCQGSTSYKTCLP